MKWFKHFTDGHESENLITLRVKFGWEWLARWYVLLEMVAAKMDASDRCHLEYPLRDWCRFMDCSPRQLLDFFTFLVSKKIGGCSIEVDPELLRSYSEVTPKLRKDSASFSSVLLKIYLPNLLKNKDEYTSNIVTKSRHVSGQTHSQIQKREERLLSPPIIPPLPKKAEPIPPETGGDVKNRSSDVCNLVSGLTKSKTVKRGKPAPTTESEKATEVNDAAIAICDVVKCPEQDKARIFQLARKIAITHGIPTLWRIKGTLEESIRNANPPIKDPLKLALWTLNKSANVP